jgi:hypothetical protein
MRGVRYFGFVDPSGGSSDSMTVAVAHREADRVIIDLVRERRPPFSPTDVEFSAALRSYNVGSVQSDKYAGSWVMESFAAQGIRCEQSASIGRNGHGQRARGGPVRSSSGPLG